MNTNIMEDTEYVLRVDRATLIERLQVYVDNEDWVGVEICTAALVAIQIKLRALGAEVA